MSGFFVQILRGDFVCDFEWRLRVEILSGDFEWEFSSVSGLGSSCDIILVNINTRVIK